MLSIEDQIKAAISINRVGTYEQLKGVVNHGILLPLPLSQAIDLYAWNAQVSAAFLFPLHICEVVTRNAVADVLVHTYGPDWPRNNTFLKSLPDTKPPSYNMHRDLLTTRQKHPTTGKVIPELKFAFWQRMFTARFDVRLWNPHLSSVFQTFPVGQSVNVNRKLMYASLEQVRLLRNRIAHHEPIFARNLQDDFQKIGDIIHWRCPITASWMKSKETVSALLGAKPICLAPSAPLLVQSNALIEV